MKKAMIKLKTYLTHPISNINSKLWIIGLILLTIILVTGCIKNSEIIENTTDNLTTQNHNSELKPVSSRDLSTLQLTPQPGEYFTDEGGKSKLLLNDSNLKYCYLSEKDICLSDAANVGDLGIVINGTIKNEYDRGYYILMSACTFNPEGEPIGGITDRGPICGTIVLHVKSGQTDTFEMHLKYGADIEQIAIRASVHEVPPP